MVQELAGRQRSEAGRLALCPFAIAIHFSKQVCGPRSHQERGSDPTWMKDTTAGCASMPGTASGAMPSDTAPTWAGEEWGGRRSGEVSCSRPGVSPFARAVDAKFARVVHLPAHPLCQSLSE